MASIFNRPKDPSEVFTPRSHEVNSVMYVNRPDHEAALRRAIRAGYNIVVHGESGCGKSWLYKKVFLDDGVFYKVVDFSTAGDADEVDILLLDAVTEYIEWNETSKTSEREV